MADLMFREHTWDKNIWRSVAEHNEYALPDTFAADDVILDIGAHIGSFAYACLHRGAGKVICLEPDPENFLYLRHNLHYACKATDRAVCISAACWRSDKQERCVYYTPVGINTGGGNTLGDSSADADTPVTVFSLNALVTLARSLAASDRLRLVKLDCEGSEWPILYTADVYDKVDAFIGEYHPLLPVHFPDLVFPYANDLDGLRTFFTERGYAFDGSPRGELGIFKAWKPGKEI